ncbi:hypothetical protein AAFF_G00314860 [Aldrovandia affinis]|uniref:Uncharacterized protein n=1 Tax=Aldrovandia affinis TaxID=143900 RepID=A0AAD7R7A1_9TELE|nr:hypothetical protein AAFF_G00314860 [Aldrovandia affinis]
MSPPTPAPAARLHIHQTPAGFTRRSDQSKEPVPPHATNEELAQAGGLSRSSTPPPGVTLRPAERAGPTQHHTCWLPLRPASPLTWLKKLQFGQEVSSCGVPGVMAKAASRM